VPWSAWPRDYSYDLQQFVALIGDKSPGEITFRDIDHFVSALVCS
jgi:hypothetical protein